MGRRGSEAGFTLIETMMVLGTVTLTILGVITAHLTCARLAQVNHETQLAAQSVRTRLEEIAASDVSQIPAIYDTVAANDPNGSGTAPGATFTVAGLAANSAGVRGVVELPVNGSGQVREDITNAALGMPRDLNGDGTIDSLDHAADFKILPVQVRIRWKGLSGDREMRLHTVVWR